MNWNKRRDYLCARRAYICDVIPANEFRKRLWEVFE